MAALLGLAVGCGGGGGGIATGTVIGRILNVLTGGPPNPAATVQVGSNSVLTSLSDGSFQLTAPNGTAQLSVDNGVPPLWLFAIGPVSGNTDVGDLWVGPERVILRGKVLKANDNSPISGAAVSFAGKSDLTDATGQFDIADVAYASATQTAFWGIIGAVSATGFFRQEFSAQPFTASGGVVDIGNVLITPASDPNPPGTPFNIWGVVSAPGGASGSIVRLKLAGTDIRVFNVGTDGRYVFFVAPGSYVISASKGASTAPDIPVMLSQPNQVIRQDVTIP
jgi:hypothetical protein